MWYLLRPDPLFGGLRLLNTTISTTTIPSKIQTQEMIPIHLLWRFPDVSTTNELSGSFSVTLPTLGRLIVLEKLLASRPLDDSDEIADELAEEAEESCARFEEAALLELTAAEAEAAFCEAADAAEAADCWARIFSVSSAVRPFTILTALLVADDTGTADETEVENAVTG